MKSKRLCGFLIASTLTFLITKNAIALLEIKNIANISLEGLKKPASLSVDRAGWIYVTDAVGQEVVVFDKNGDFKFKFGKKEGLVIPWGIRVSKQGIIYITDIGDHKVKAFDLRGIKQFEFGKEGDGRGEFVRPYDIAIDKKGDLYVVDSANYRIQVFDKRGKYKTRFGRQGARPGEFGFPNAIAIDREGYLHIVDTVNCGVQVFDRRGNFIRNYGLCGSGPGETIDPQGISIDTRYGLVYLSDSGNYRVQVFTSSGRFLTDFKGRTGLFSPTRSVYTKGDLYYVIDKDNKKLQIYKIILSERDISYLEERQDEGYGEQDIIEEIEEHPGVISGTVSDPSAVVEETPGEP